MLTPDRVAEVLAITEESAVEQGLRALLLREMAKLEVEVARFRERYGVLGPESLRNAIAEQQIPGHPAWEEMIDWQNCLADYQQIRHLLEDTGNANTQPLPRSA